MTDTNIKEYVEQGLGQDAASVYDQFGDEYKNLGNNSPLDGINRQKLRMYAADKIMDIEDFSGILEKIRDSYSALKKICNRPKSHLKSINEVRPIDTVKRVGYESIPYLASHSEDWLARTATGLKPARLFSRVEEVDYHIYENRVVKTLVDKILKFLKGKMSDLTNKHSQIHSIINRDTKTYSFGFDKDFQIAVSKLLPSKYSGNDEQIRKQGELAQRLLKECKKLQRKFRDLKQSRLYKLLHNAKQVMNPLNETNILLFDRDYNQVFALWKEMQSAISAEVNEEIKPKTDTNQQQAYYDYCYALIQFALDSLKFTTNTKDSFVRSEDHFSANIFHKDNSIRLQIKDITKRSLPLENGLNAPIAHNETFGKFSRSGDMLYWENDIIEKGNEIETFCKKIITAPNNSKEQQSQRHQYNELKKSIIDTNRKAGEVKEKDISVVPLCCEIKDSDELRFKRCIQAEYGQTKDFKIVALPLVQQTEQKLTNYAINSNENTAVLPLSLFDINSYRRLQKIILRVLTELSTDNCPYCGSSMRDITNGRKCDKCNLIMTTTTCPNDKCKYTYKYLWYETNEEVLSKMEMIQGNDFLNKDSRFQYKDIVGMRIRDRRLSPICPRCKLN